MRRDWIPTGVALGIALVLWGLSGDPFALRPIDVEPGGPLWWGSPAFLHVSPLQMVEPRGTLREFPVVFRWGAYSDAAHYEVTCGPDQWGAKPLFRQVQSSTKLEIAPGTLRVPPGNYLWEVRARAAGSYAARGLVHFRIDPTAIPSDSATSAR